MIRRSNQRIALLPALLAGSALCASGACSKTPEPDTVSAADAPLGRLREEWFKANGALPSPEQEAAYIDEWVQDEVLYRRALELDLDKNDAVVRQRLVEKMRARLAGALQVTPPTDAQLQAWLNDHRAAFETPKKTSFTHVFFSRNTHGTQLTTVARAALKALSTNPDAAITGDPFFRGQRFEAATTTDLERAFGSEFAERIDGLPMNAWTGPLSSPYGSHLVRVTKRTEPEVPSLNQVRASVEQHWMDAERKRQSQKAIEQLRREYAPIE